MSVSSLGVSGVPVRTEAEFWAHMGFSVKMWGQANWKASEGNRPSEILALFYVRQQNCEVGEVILTLSSTLSVPTSS